MKKTFDKEKARSSFIKSHPKWESDKRNKAVTITAEILEKIIALYPDTELMLIAGICEIPYSHVTQLTRKLRKDGLLPKEPRKRPSLQTTYEKAIAELKAKKKS